MTDSKFTNYRENFSGRPWSRDALEPGRPESVANMQSCFDLLETTLLADGRDWILKTDKPSLADIEGWLLNNLVPKSSELIFMIAIWPFDWLVELKSSMRQALSPKNNSPRYLHGFSVSEQPSRQPNRLDPRQSASGGRRR